MYEFLNGTVRDRGPTHAVLEVQGVGFLLEVSLRTSTALPSSGEPTTLLTLLKPQEDALRLFGFVDQAERELFRALTAIAGIGPTHALALLSAFSPDEVLAFADAGDAKALARSKGIGPKLAQRICIELAGRPARTALPTASAPAAGDASTPVEETEETGPHADAMDALLVLGFTEPQAKKAVDKAARQLGEEADVETLVRHALRGG